MTVTDDHAADAAGPDKRADKIPAGGTSNRADRRDETPQQKVESIGCSHAYRRKQHVGRKERHELFDKGRQQHARKIDRVERPLEGLAERSKRLHSAAASVVAVKRRVIDVQHGCGSKQADHFHLWSFLKSMALKKA